VSAELSDIVTDFRATGFEACREEWNGHDAYAGRAIRMQGPDGMSVSGMGAGVNANGAYLLRDACGEVHAFNGGELSLRLDGRP
jgi:biotin-(acetyl-CoA carboxylase) ligase